MIMLNLNKEQQLMKQAITTKHFVCCSHLRNKATHKHNQF